jgi:hypothetical protein
MTNHRLRKTIPALYGSLVAAGFIISTNVGVIVCIVGGTLSGVLWSALKGPR